MNSVILKKEGVSSGVKSTFTPVDEKTRISSDLAMNTHTHTRTRIGRERGSGSVAMAGRSGRS